MKNAFLRLLLIVILITLVWVIRYAGVSFPIISGYNAKQMCTCVFVSGRDPKDIDTSDLKSITTLAELRSGYWFI